MAINFSEETNHQKYLVLVLIVIVLITFFILRQSFSEPGEETGPTQEVFQLKDIEINFEVLQLPIIKELQAFEEIGPFSGQVGRENPFISY